MFKFTQIQINIRFSSYFVFQCLYCRQCMHPSCTKINYITIRLEFIEMFCEIDFLFSVRCFFVVLWRFMCRSYRERKLQMGLIIYMSIVMYDLIRRIYLNDVTPVPIKRNIYISALYHCLHSLCESSSFFSSSVYLFSYLTILLINASIEKRNAYTFKIMD